MIRLLSALYSDFEEVSKMAVEAVLRCNKYEEETGITKRNHGFSQKEK